ncbi:MAG: ATP-grasp domain-containing protein [Myxococcales bacterium]|nr:ATP-grasp domain-containing protein [Myxococcota bacterium]MDW8282033.1 ATP-grasp domain-containing protein [Myxococcales bacterium]
MTKRSSALQDGVVTGSALPRATPAPSGPLRILLTDAQELAALGALRSLGRAGHEVTLAYPAQLRPPASVRSRHCAATLCHPDPWREHAAFRAWLADVARSYDVVLPVSEACIAAAASIRRLTPTGARPLWLMPSDESLRYTLSKYRATEAAQRLGLLTPRTVFVTDGSAGSTFNDDLSGLRYPLVVKTDNHLDGHGAYRKGGTVMACRPEEAAALLAECRESGAATLVQEMVPGHGAGAFLLRHQGQVRLRFAHRRLHEVPWSGGFSSFRQSVHDQEALAQAERLLAGIGYQGVAMVEFRRGSLDGRLYFLEINGRLWGSLALALHAGVDFPLHLLEANLGREAEPVPNYPAGMRCRNLFPGEILYLRSVLRARVVPGLPPPPDRLSALWEFVWLCLDPRVRHDHLWWSDPLPGIDQALHMGRFLLDKLGQAGWRTLERQWTRRRLLPRMRDRQRLGALPPGGSILFLCYGNICRSPFAEAYWNRRLRELGAAGPRALSAGFHPQAGRCSPSRFAMLGRCLGVDLTSHRSRVLSAEMARAAEVIFVMDLDDVRSLAKLCADVLPHTCLLGPFAPSGRPEIADPYGLEPAQALQVCQDLAAALEGLLQHVVR